ncbi:TPA: hypothetical protein ACY36Y_002203 [Pasteurella multocida]|uniref:hypothetical protein n=1 Tax=Pasteurella multocida TaxID=747 RepID=UPI0023E3D954|nr:hypothetical protein [Pasteurella multocida]
MTKITIRNGNKYIESKNIREIGKKGRQARMFEKSRKMTTLWEKAVVRPTAVDKAISLAQREKKLTDVANYNCNKGQSSVNTVRAVQKRRLGCRELI